MVAHGRRGSIAPVMEKGKYLTMAGYSQCPAGLPVSESKQKCNTGVYIESWNSHHVNEPLRYERNEKVLSILIFLFLNLIYFTQYRVI